MNRRVLAILLGLFVSSAALAGGWKTFLSPGPVHKVHDEFAGDCDSCHLVFDGIPDSKCLDCHEAIGTRIKSGEGFHANAEGTCIDCHGDHLGLKATITKEPALASFDHKATGFDLDGSHSDVKCESCHDKPIAEIAGLCGECHEDVHESFLGPNCNACHQPVAWDQDIKSLTDHKVPMLGGHEELYCNDCHKFGENLSKDTVCKDCHDDDAHDGTDASCDQCHKVEGWKPAEFNHGPCSCSFQGKHQTAGCLDCHADFDFSDTPEECSGCHLADRTHDDLGGCAACHTAGSWKDNLFDHNKATKFPIDGAHLQVSCLQCHTTEGEFKGAAQTCQGCHQQAGDEAHGDFGACVDCHTTGKVNEEGSDFSISLWIPSTFDHATTGFELTGQHTKTNCKKCHEDDNKVKAVREKPE